MTGVAARSFRYNRIGFNLLHSVAAVRDRPSSTLTGRTTSTARTYGCD